MDYQVGTAGRIIVARFGHGEDPLAGLERIARQEGLQNAQFQLIGALGESEYVAGPETARFPPVPVWHRLQDPHELVGLGTIFQDHEGPRVHCHALFARGDRVMGGCLRKQAEAFLVIEAVITEIRGIEARRALDAASGMTLLQLGEKAP